MADAGYTGQQVGAGIGGFLENFARFSSERKQREENKAEKEQAKKLQNLHLLNLMEDAAARKRLQTAAEALSEFGPTIERGFGAGEENLSAIVNRALQGEARQKEELGQAFTSAKRQGIPNLDRKDYFGSSPEEVAKQKEESAALLDKERAREIKKAINIQEAAGNLGAIKQLLRELKFVDPAGHKEISGDIFPEAQKPSDYQQASGLVGEAVKAGVITPDQQNSSILRKIGLTPKEDEEHKQLERLTISAMKEDPEITEDEAVEKARGLQAAINFKPSTPPAGLGFTKEIRTPIEGNVSAKPVRSGASAAPTEMGAGIDSEMVTLIKRKYKSYNEAKESYKKRRALPASDPQYITDEEFQTGLRNADVAFPRTK